MSARLYKSWAFETLNRNAPSFRSAPVFLPPLYKSFAFNALNATFPFPQVFSLSPFPLKGNPRWPRSGGQLNAIDFVTIAIPSLRSLRSRHNLRHFSYYATSPAWQLRNRTPRILVLHTQGLPHVKNKRTCMWVRKMKAQFLACGKRNTKTKRQTIATCCNRCKMGLCVT